MTTILTAYTRNTNSLLFYMNGFGIIIFQRDAPLIVKNMNQEKGCERTAMYGKLFHKACFRTSYQACLCAFITEVCSRARKS